MNFHYFDYNLMCLAIGLLLSGFLNSQTSFIKELKFGGSFLHGNLINLNERGDLVIYDGHDLFQASDFQSQFNLITIDKNGAFDSGISIAIDSISGSTPGSQACFESFGEFQLVAFSNLGFEPASLICLNEKENIQWAKKTSIETLTNIAKIIPTSNEKVIVLTRLFSDIKLNFENTFGFSGLTGLDLRTGTTEWSYIYNRKDSTNHIGFFVQEFEELQNGNIAIFSLTKNSESFNFQTGLILLSPDGKIEKSITFDSLFYDFNAQNDPYQFQSLTSDSENNIYISGKLDKQTDWNNNNIREGFIAKFNSELELQWAKRLSAANFSLTGVPIKVNSKDEIVFGYYTTGNFPTILGKIDSGGKLLNHDGYSFHSPAIQVGEDGSFYFFTKRKFNQDGGLEFGYMIGKTTPSGEFENCPQFNACLDLFDFELKSHNLEWERVPADTLTNLTFKYRNFDGTLEEYCNTAVVPNAYFSLPDSICQFECLSPDSLKNQNAHAINWTVHKDTVVHESDDNSFNYCFDQPGNYQIEQEIWLLGCSEFFTHEVVVLPDSLGSLLGDDRIVCKDSIITLTPNSSRPLKTFEWNDGSDLPNLTISQSGIYTIEASDGFCTERDRIAVTFFEDQISGTALELPSDTSLCDQFLPFSLRPQSDFSNEFYLNDESIPQSIFEINEPGNYQIRTTIEGCDLVESFNLNLRPCEVEIYIPSSFSPNNDGINDFIEPLGKDFLGKKLEVYDRWGGKLFETKEAPFSWNGAEATQGVYVLIFSYLNLRNQKEEVVSADVLVAK